MVARKYVFILLEIEVIKQPTDFGLLEGDQSFLDSQRNVIFQASSGHDFFFNLKNVTFCGFHPREPRYFGFVTKHPEKIKYACHVFIGQRTTQPVAEACG